MFDELHSFSWKEVLVLSAIARNHEMIENSKYKKSFQHELDSLLIDIDKIESREWRPTDENHQVHMLACDLRLHVQYSSINAGIKIDTDTSEELKDFLLQDEFDVIVHNDVPGYLYFYTANAIANVGALIGLARMQKMFHEIFNKD